MVQPKITMVGRTYGRLTVLEQAEPLKKDRQAWYRCRCDCGGEIAGASCGSVESPGKTEKLFFSLLLFLSFVVSSNCRSVLYHDKLLTEERCLWIP